MILLVWCGRVGVLDQLLLHSTRDWAVVLVASAMDHEHRFKEAPF